MGKSIDDDTIATFAADYCSVSGARRQHFVTTDTEGSSSYKKLTQVALAERREIFQRRQQLTVAMNQGCRLRRSQRGFIVVGMLCR